MAILESQIDDLKLKVIYQKKHQQVVNRDITVTELMLKIEKFDVAECA
jgi:hypothetical protein